MTFIADQPRSFEHAIDAYLARPDLARASLPAYRNVLERLAAELDRQEHNHDPQDWPSADELETAVHALWGDRAPATWNRNATIVRSFIRWSARHRYVDIAPELELDRRREHIDRARAIPYPALERLFTRPGIALREKTFWRLLYETAARAGELLALDVEDLDQPNKRARIRSKGGDLELVHYASGSAQLLPRLIAGRRHGPVFLTARAAPPGTPTLDTCPVTGRARLSYRRAAAIFTEQSGGWTLHQLRHSALTHLAEQGVSTTLLMAKSRHRSLRSLERYARPGADAVAALTAAHDPARRRP